MTFIVYKLTSPSAKSYIGFTRNSLAVRWSGHINNWNRWCVKSSRSGATTKLFYAFNKYHPELWTKEILYTSSDETDAFHHERLFIEEFDSVNNGYNLSSGGFGGATGLKRSDEDKARKSDARKAYYATDKGKEWLLELAEQTRKRSAKVWTITSPDGNVFDVPNVRTWASSMGFSPNGAFSTFSQTGKYKGYKGVRKNATKE